MPVLLGNVEALLATAPLSAAGRQELATTFARVAAAAQREEASAEELALAQALALALAAPREGEGAP